MRNETEIEIEEIEIKLGFSAEIEICFGYLTGVEIELGAGVEIKRLVFQLVAAHFSN